MTRVRDKKIIQLILYLKLILYQLHYLGSLPFLTKGRGDHRSAMVGRFKIILNIDKYLPPHHCKQCSPPPSHDGDPRYHNYYKIGIYLLK